VRIGIDARAASHPQRGGFKTYTDNLIHHLPQVDEDNHYTFYVDRPMAHTSFQSVPHVTVKVIPSRLPLVGAVVREQVELPLHLLHDGVDVVHFPAITAPLIIPCPFVVTIHDIITWDEKPKLAGLRLDEAIKRWSLHFYDSHLSRLAAKRACLVITVSRNSKRDIVNKTRLNPDRVRVIYEAPSPIFTPTTNCEDLDRFCVARRLQRPFIMGLSSASPRKNALGLVNAYAKLSSEVIQEYRLVIVWTHGLWKNEIGRHISRLGLQNRTVFLEDVSDEELRILYSAASLFVFPSFYEGFGLPPLEAMACGTPVVASNTSSLPEVLGTAALLVDPRDTVALAQAMS